MINFDAIPAELKTSPNWVLWRSEERRGKITKVPYRPAGSRASSTDPATWSTYDVIKSAYERGPDMWNGIGFVLQPPYVGIDFDRCISYGGQIEPQVANNIRRLDSYWERSPSGKGIHLIAKGTIPHGRKCPLFEIYQKGRYFTMTGDWLEGTPGTIEERSSELLSIYQETFGSGVDSVTEKLKPNLGPGRSLTEVPKSNRSMNELVLRLERHGDKITVYGARGSYSADISRSEQTRVYFDLLTRAVQAEHEETMVILKVKTKELYLVKAINEDHLRKDRDALECFQNATRGFKMVIAENMITSGPGGREITLIKEKVGLFVNELHQIGITAFSEGVVNDNFVRISVQPKGFIDVYSTRRRQPS